MNDSTMTVRVARRTIEADGIVSFELASPDGRDLPAFDAGSHIDVHLPAGHVRQYSLCSAPHERSRYQIAVLREAQSRGGSAGMHDVIKEGDALRVSLPRNHFALVAGPARHLLLAGGIGLTPLLCMAQQLDRSGGDFELHYCARSRSRAAFVERLANASWAQRVQYHFDDEDAHQRLHLDALLKDVHADTHLYVCGPQGFMNAVLDAARANGWPENRLHYEFFSAPAVDTSSDGAFDVCLARSGKTVTIPADRSVAQALADAGVDVPVSCEQGICGTCITRVLDGEPEHRDLFLSPEEQARNDQFLPCCSRSKSRRLVLDL
ncbi:vanillate O-demethylase oxidoreductase [Burkholderia sp. SFA1]|uniref:PDR/VanB family oxidoreductase n=1 Tax=Caballeronia sp. CLC5 TaxID=2906764 RepID=UPI001F242314|nr:PDR/VanB family oxidoreductase [Caballeronia sp. CLC5]MCE4573751.1 PDR/VanB family oxidoreductase [Caballeronia sp. CLC5]BBQ00596.1 vanillate O-demethylase oxidoreductase [Burkholderia sp. SFA1]